MPTRDYERHVVSTTAPSTAKLGDEYFDPSSNNLYKLLASSGTNVAWTQVLLSGNTFNGGTVTGAVNITNSTAASSTTTGALQVAGGVGVGGGLNVGGAVTAANINIAGTSQFGTNASGAVALFGVGGNGRVIIQAGASNNAIYTEGSSSLAIAPNGLLTGGLLINTTGDVSAINTTQSGSTNTGALIVTGGAGIGQNLFVGNNFVTSGTSTLVGTTTIQSVTASTSTTTGALQVTGGVGTRGNIVVGGYGQFIGTYTEDTTVPGAYIGIAGTPGATTPRFGFFNGTASQNWQIDNNSGTFRWFTPGVSRMELSPTGILSVLTITNSVSTTTGAVIVTGGVGIGQNLFVGNNFVTSGTSTLVGASVHQGAGTFNSTLGVAGNFNVTGTTLLSSTSVFNGAATANSTLGVAGNFNVTGTIIGSSTISDSIGNVRTIPQNPQTAIYTLQATDNGKHISLNNNVTVPANIFAIGSNVMIYNSGTTNITITTATNIFMYLAGTATTGTRTLAQHGLATLVYVTTSTIVISGAGLT